MEQNDRAVLDPSEVNTGSAGEVPPSAVDGAQEHASEARDPVRADASEGAEKQDHEGPSPEPSEAVAASGSVESEDRGAFENSIAIATHFEFQSAAADATPPDTYLRSRSRGRKQVVPTKFVAAGAAEGAGSEDPVPRAPATGAHEGVSAVADGDHSDAPVDDKKLKRACSAPGATVAIAHASPPDSYRRVPSRSRKQYSPKRFVAVPTGGHSPPAASLASALPSTSASGPRAATSGVIDALASSSSNRPPCRGRKQPRPEHFIPEEAEASASAKARRSDNVLDRFLSSIVHGTPASDAEWVRNVTAEDAAVRNQSGGEGFRIRDASRHAARARAAISRLGASCGGPCSSASAPGSPPGEPDGKGRFYGILAVLGASLALSVVSCVLFYIVGQSSESGPSAEKQDKVNLTVGDVNASGFSKMMATYRGIVKV
ncbi:unnamed protein product [Alopecurus aequalis]